MYAVAVRPSRAVDRHLAEFSARGFVAAPPPRSSIFVRRDVVETMLESAVAGWPDAGLQPPHNMCHGYLLDGVDCYWRCAPVGVHRADQIYTRVRRVCGWLRHAPEYPLLWRVFQRGVSVRGMGSPATLLCPVTVAQTFESPGHAERWLRAVRRTANRILAGWRLRVSMADLAAALDDASHVAQRQRDSLAPRRYGCRSAGRSAAVATAVRVLGEPDGRTQDWPWWRTLAALRASCPHRPGDHSGAAPAEQIGTALAQRFGRQHDDDTASLWQPRIVAMCDSGAVIASGKFDPHRGPDSVAAQVVVTDHATGNRCHLTVPPQFARPLDRDETASQRVRAALAWTFQMTGRDYSPDIQT